MEFGVHQSGSGRFWEKTTCVGPTWIRTPDHPAHGLVATPTTLYRIVERKIIAIRKLCCVLVSGEVSLV